MKKMDMLQCLKKEKIVAVIRMEPKEAIAVIHKIIEGGVHFIEVTLTVPGALEMISVLAKEYKNSDVVIGSGTVLDPVAARLSILNGAEFVVAPSFNPEIAKMCNLYGKAYIPGIYTPNDIAQALEYGVDVLKLFPATDLPASTVKTLKGPFPQADFLISGSMTAEKFDAWLKGGAFCVAVGGALTNYDKTEGIESIVNKAREFTAIAKKYDAKGR